MKSNKGKNTTIDMPEVKDIPRQEHPPVNPVDNIDNATVNPETDVTDAEKQLLDQAELPPEDVELVQRLKLDETDGEEPLNVQGNAADMGADLDVPGSELDDHNEEIGEEDEENNAFSNSNLEEE